MSDAAIVIQGIGWSLLTSFFLWYAVEDEEYRRRIERGEFS